MHTARRSANLDTESVLIVVAVVVVAVVDVTVCAFNIFAATTAAVAVADRDVFKIMRKRHRKQQTNSTQNAY